MARQDVFGWGRYDPFEEMRRLQEEVNRAFSASVAGGRALAPGEFPALSVYANEDGVAVTAELPGVKAEELEVSAFQDTLTLRGKRPAPAEARAWHRRERQQGEFVRTLNLPFPVDPERVEGNLENGVLRLSLHRPEQDKPKRIKISAA